MDRGAPSREGRGPRALEELTGWAFGTLEADGLERLEHLCRSAAPVRVIVSDRVPTARRANSAARKPKVRFETLYVR
ncbi:hypothetical protein ACWC2K_36825 [Streptomyces chattanoogensis]